MGTRRKRERQRDPWIVTSDVVVTAGNAFYDRLNGILDEHKSENPMREQLARFDRKRKKKGSNQDWESPSDPDARITRMKDGPTHLAHKAEQAVDLSTGAVLAITLQPADAGDTTTIHTTLQQAQHCIPL
jgi:transposase